MVMLGRSKVSDESMKKATAWRQTPKRQQSGSNEELNKVILGQCLRMGIACAKAKVFVKT